MNNEADYVAFMMEAIRQSTGKPIDSIDRWISTWALRAVGVDASGGSYDAAEVIRLFCEERKQYE